VNADFEEMSAAEFLKWLRDALLCLMLRRCGMVVPEERAAQLVAEADQLALHLIEEAMQANAQHLVDVGALADRAQRFQSAHHEGGAAQLGQPRPGRATARPPCARI
jgi:hypothetical protein